jgi:cold shock CspA family protein
VKDGYGFIKCAHRDARLFFHFSGLADAERSVRVGDCVQFAVVPVDQSHGGGGGGDAGGGVNKVSGCAFFTPRVFFARI